MFPPVDMSEGTKPEPLHHPQLSVFLAWAPQTKKSLFTQPHPKYLWELDIIILMTLAQKDKSEVSTHPAEVISEHRLCPSPGIPQGPARGALHPALHQPQIAPTSVVPIPMRQLRGGPGGPGGCRPGEWKSSPAATSGLSILLFFWLPHRK